MNFPVTYEALDRWRRWLGYEWRGPWQSRAVQWLCEHRYCTMKGPRQSSGKTFIAGKLFASYFLFMGADVVCAFPTLVLGARVLGEGIDESMAKVERKLGSKLRRLTDNVNYKRWSNGARLFMLSADMASKVEGVTAQLLIWDEGQEADVKRYADMGPYLDVAEKAGTARCIILGVGGSRQNLLSTMSRNPEFAPLEMTVDEIVAHDASYGPLFDRRRCELGDVLYEQHYLCRDFDEGERVLLGEILPAAEYAPGFPVEYIYAIDVGRKTDQTVVGVFEYGPAPMAGPQGEQLLAINLIKVHRIPRVSFTDKYYYAGELVTEIDRPRYKDSELECVWGQAHYIYDFITGEVPAGHFLEPSRVRMERNAIGEGLHDELAGRWLPGMAAPYITNEHKSPTGAGYRDRLISRLSTLCRTGLFGCADSGAREELENLRYNISEREDKTVRQIDHSDILSMALIGISGIGV